MEPRTDCASLGRGSGLTFRRARLWRPWASLCSSCWSSISRSSSQRLSFSSCWNSRSSKSLVSVSRASASCAGRGCLEEAV